MTTSLLYQTIDQLSREKGIDPQIIISAVEDAILVATRKYYKSNEDLQSHFNKETGAIEVYAVKKVVEQVAEPDHEVELGRAEGRMPRRDQLRLETYQIGDRLRAVIKEVDRAARGPQVVVSRADAMLVQRLFEMEVPEIYDGTVVIRAIAREAGERSKVAVFSKDPDVDCVGACVGMKGMRV